MKETLVSFETAKLAKMVGFKSGSFSTYHTDGSSNTSYSNGSKVNGHSNMTNGFEAPTQSLLQKWLREEHNTVVIVQYGTYVNNPLSSPYFYIRTSDNEFVGHKGDSYEEVLEEGLKKALRDMLLNK